jgi:hypothetical protein
MTFFMDKKILDTSFLLLYFLNLHIIFVQGDILQHLHNVFMIYLNYIHPLISFPLFLEEFQ